MARPLSKDLRERIVAVVEGGESRQAAARRFSVSASCVIKLMQRWRRMGSIEPGQMGGWKDYRLADHEAVVRALVAEHPDLTLEELRDELARRGIPVSRSSVDRFLKARQLTLKKSRCVPPNRTDRMWQRRAQRGRPANREWTQTGWSSSTKPGRPPT
jgi:transposase